LPRPARNSPWWDRSRHADRRGFLTARNRILSALRRWFESEGFIEVSTAQLQTSPGNEVHLHAFATELITPEGARQPLYLSTSPEFACKKLLAAGEERIFTFAPAYRNRERGPLHHPEFTMLEWYRANEPYEKLMEDCATLLALAGRAAEAAALRHGARSADPFVPPERLTVAEAFDRFAGIDLPAALRGQAPDPAALARAARAAGVNTSEGDSLRDVFTRILVDKIEPVIGNGRATLLVEYPASLSSFARPKPADGRFAERFELYACGVELANAFGELTDAREQRRRLEAEMAEKEHIYGERYPIDEDFLAALDEMPPTSGAALGFDRLVMLATGASRIEQVVWTPVAEGRS
jgi:lysyl-tRNA synthetase class 2